MDNNLKIINYLGKHNQEEFTMHGLSNLLKIPYATFYRTINSMTDLLIIKSIGKSKTIKLNMCNSIIQSYLAISSEQEKKEFISTNRLIKIIENDLDTKDIVLLFGSFAKRTENKKSDIDIIIINKNGEKTISFSKHEIILNREINPMFFREDEFISMLRDREENVGKQALKNHIILNNSRRFWEVIMDAI